MITVMKLAMFLLPAGLGLGLQYAKTPGEAGGWLVVTLVWCGVGLGMARYWGHAEDVSTLRTIFCGALGIRIMAAVVGNYWAPPWMFAEDDGLYDAGAWSLARYWSDTPRIAPTFPREPGYFYLLASLYFIFGRAYLAGLALNAGAGALLALLTYRLALEFMGERRIALRAACLVALLPSLVIWSSMLLKDVWTALLVLMALLYLGRVQAGHILAVVGLGAAFALLAVLRTYMFLALGLGCGLAIAVSTWRFQPKRLFVVLATVGVLLTFHYQFHLGEAEIRLLSLERLAEIRRSMASGGSVYYPDVRLSDPAQAVLFLPIGLGYFLLAPFPWMMRDLRYALTVPDMCILYLCLSQAFLAIWGCLKNRLRHTISLVVPVIVIIVMYSLISSNMGTAYRHRAQILAPLMVLAAVGMVRGGRQRTRPAGQNVSTIPSQPTIPPH